MRNEVVEEFPSDLVGESYPKPDGAPATVAAPAGEETKRATDERPSRKATQRGHEASLEAARLSEKLDH